MEKKPLLITFRESLHEAMKTQKSHKEIKKENVLKRGYIMMFIIIEKRIRQKHYVVNLEQRIFGTNIK